MLNHHLVVSVIRSFVRFHDVNIKKIFFIIALPDRRQLLFAQMKTSCRLIKIQKLLFV